MPDYPRQLVLDDETLDDLRRYLDTILTEHDVERGDSIDDLIRYQTDYWAKPSTTRRTFPFTGAADIIIPLAAISFETIHARVMTQLFGLKEFTVVRAKAEQWNDAAPHFRNFLDHELRNSINFKKKIEPALMEIGKFGTGIAKAGYVKQVKYGVREYGGVETEFPIVVKQGAAVDSVAFSRYLMPYSATDPQTAGWCGEEHSMTPEQVRINEEGGLFAEGTFENIKAWVQTTVNTENKFERNQEELENREVTWPSRLNIVEIWCSFDIDKSKSYREIVVHYHRDSRSIVSLRYNWHDDLRRPYRTGVYFPVEHRWTGIGVCKQVEQFQREVTTQHRQRLDNATLANMRMIKISKMSGYGPKEPVFPGKMWFLDDMTHVESMQLGEIYPSAYNNEQQTLIYEQQRTGVNEVTLGMPAVGTPGTATGDLQRVQEGRKKFDYTFGNIKSFVNEVIIDVACNLKQFGPRNVQYFSEVQGGELVRQILTLPEGFIRDGLAIEVGAAGEQENKIIDRQNWTQIAGMLTQYYTSAIQLAQLQGNKQMTMAIAQKALVASTEAMKQILESYDLRNIDRIVMMELINAANAPRGANQLLNTGGVGSAGSPPNNGAVASIAEVNPRNSLVGANGAGGLPLNGRGVGAEGVSEGY